MLASLRGLGRASSSSSPFLAFFSPSAAPLTHKHDLLCTHVNSNLRNRSVASAFSSQRSDSLRPWPQSHHLLLNRSPPGRGAPSVPPCREFSHWCAPGLPTLRCSSSSTPISGDSQPRPWWPRVHGCFTQSARPCGGLLSRRGLVAQRVYTPEMIDQLAEGVKANDRLSLSRAITLVESQLDSHRKQAQVLFDRLLQHRRELPLSFRVGISGPPGVGKSTFIEAFGTHLTTAGHRVAVLAIDPSSVRSGGSILGDKTRMSKLARNPDAFIRPSPSRGSLGGVTRNTGDAMLLCEAAGYDVILIETVGVGQSEYAMDDMVDIFVLLANPGAGDELQGMKKGIMELADLILVNKADGHLAESAELARVQFVSALRLMRAKHSCWEPRVAKVSSVNEKGLDDAWQLMIRFQKALISTGTLSVRRKEQYSKWMWKMFEEEVMRRVTSQPSIQSTLPELHARVRSQEMTPSQAVDILLERLDFGKEHPAK